MTRNWLRNVAASLTNKRPVPRRTRRMTPGEAGRVQALEQRILLANPTVTGITNNTINENIGVDSYVDATGNTSPYVDPITGATVFGNSSNGTFVGRVIGNANDAGQVVNNFAIAGFNGTTSPFRIDAATGDLYVNNSDVLNFENNSSITITVNLRDSANETGSGTVTINLRDINETPFIPRPGDIDQQFRFVENAVAGTVLENGNNGVILASTGTTSNTGNGANQLAPNAPGSSGRGTSELSGQTDTASNETNQTFGGATTNRLSYEILRANVSTSTAGTTGINEVQLVAKPENLISGSFLLSFNSTVPITTTTQGAPLNTNEVQVINLNGGSGSFFTLTFNGQTTRALSYTATAAEVQAELQLLTTIGSNNVGVTGGSGGPWTVTFQGSLSAQNVNSLSMTAFTNALSYTATNAQIQAALQLLPTIGTGNVAVRNVVSQTLIQNGSGSGNEIQNITANTPGTAPFRLQFQNFLTTELDGSSSAAEVQQALERLPSIGTGNVTVTSLGAGSWQVTFTGTLANQNVDTIGTGSGWYAEFQGALAGQNVNQLGIFNQSDMVAISNDRPTLGRVTVSPTALREFVGYTGDGTNGLGSGFERMLSVFGGNSFRVLMRTYDSSFIDFLNNRNIPDTDSLTYDEYITVSVLDQSEAAPVVQDEIFTISENSPNNTVVGRLNDGPNVGITTQTPGGGGQNEVQILTATTTPPAPPGSFTLTFNGQTTERINYGDDPLVVQARLEALSNIGVGNVSVTRAQPDANTNQFTITFIGALANTNVSQLIVNNGVTDPEFTQIFTYQIVGGNTNNAFAINSSTGEITVNNSAALDFETGPAYRLLVQVTDSGVNARSTTVAVDINLTDFNEPTTIPDGQQLDVEEGAPIGTQIGSVSAFDQDRVPPRNFLYEITNGNIGNTFAINPTTGVITVANNALLDSVTQPFFDLGIRVTDRDLQLSSDNSFIRINVLDVNQSAPILNDATFSTNENRPVNALIGTMTAVTTETNQQVEYFLLTTGTPFAINQTTGQITVNNPSLLNFETNASWELLVQARDTGSPSLFDTAIVTVFVNDVNEQIDINTQTRTIAENSGSGTLVGAPLVTTDPDDQDGIVQGRVFSIVSGNTNNAFTINAATGQLSVQNPSALNFEVQQTYNLGIQVNDTGLTPTTADIAFVTVTVTNANDAPVINDQTLPPLTEHRIAGTIVGTVTASDEDAGQTRTFAIIGGNQGNAFIINPTTGEIVVQNPGAIDFGQNPVFNLTVQVTDNGSPARSDTGIVTINLIDANPPIINDQTFSLNEGSSVGSSVSGGSLQVGGTGTAPFNYTIVSGNTGNAFSINSSGDLVVNSAIPLDFETNPTFTLQVLVTDAGSPQLADTATIVVNLVDVNETPVLTPQTFTVAENSAAATVVGSVSAVDPDAGQTLVYSITGGNTGNAFSINPSTGQITVNTSSALNFETTPSFSLTVTATDNGVPVASGSTTVTVNLTNVNDTPKLSPQTLNLAENSAAGTVVTTVAAVDEDLPAQTLTYAIIGGNTGTAFAIDPSTGQITVSNPAAVDFEVNPTFTLTITATDNGSPAAIGSTTVTINLTNVNDAPTVPSQSVQLVENSANGTLVATVTASDQDAGQTISYAITGGNAAGAFTINSMTGAITVANSALLDLEANPVFNLTVSATDNGVPVQTGTGTVTVTLTDVNETPTIAPQTFTINENALTGAVVGSVVAVDNDVPVQTLTYAITAGNTNGAFTINPTTGQITVATPSALNFEVTPSFSLTVTATDNGSPVLTGMGTITINLNNLNESPVVTPATFSLAENSASNTLVGTVSSSDPDVGQTRTYSITGGNTGGAFAINATTGQITVANPAALNFEATPTFNLTVTATDNGTPALSGSATVTVNLTNANDTPVIPTQSFTIAENSGNGTIVGVVSSSDEDAGQTRTFAITAGNTGGAFAINPTTGQITVANTALLNFETTPVFTLTVTATDNGVPSATGSGTVTINLTNVNDAPTILPQTFTVPENSPQGTSVGQVVASDADPGQTRTYSIIGGNVGNAFVINATTGLITVSNPSALNFEATPAFSLTVQVADSGIPREVSSAVMTINLTNVNEAPAFVPSQQVFSIVENSAAGTSVGTPNVTDPDVGQGRTFQILSGNTNNAFSINATTGQITVNNPAALNFETATAFSLSVRVTDAGSPALSSTGTIQINVTNANDAPVVNPVPLTVNAAATNGTLVGSVTASDEDAGQVRQFAIIGGNTSGAFAINPLNGAITVANAAALASGGPFSLTVQATDNGVPPRSGTGVVTINVQGNRAPVVTNSNFAVRQLSARGTVVGTVSASDPDAGQRLTYAITAGNTGSNFAINASTGQITAAKFLLQAGTYTLTVRVTDNGNPARSTNGTITIYVNRTGTLPTGVKTTTSSSSSSTSSGSTSGSSSSGSSSGTTTKPTAPAVVTAPVKKTSFQAWWANKNK